MTPGLNFTLAQIREIVRARRSEIMGLPVPWNEIVLKLISDWTTFVKSDLEGISEGMKIGALLSREYEVWSRDPNSPDPAAPQTVHAVSAEDAVFEFKTQNPGVEVCAVNLKERE